MTIHDQVSCRDQVRCRLSFNTCKMKFHILVVLLTTIESEKVYFEIVNTYFLNTSSLP